MREFKFRAWDGKRKEMIFTYPKLEYKKETMLMVMDMECLAVGIDDSLYILDECGSYEYADESRFTLMQYTGLQDKNGREIFEGDIVESGERDEAVCEIVYFGGGAFYPVCEMPGDEFEVVGNIYEESAGDDSKET